MAKNHLRLEDFRWKRKRKKNNLTSSVRGPESFLQERCVNWFRVEYPEYKQLLFSVPNGGFRTNKIGAVMKKEGMMKGVSDLLLLVPKDKFHGMAIEIKVEGRKLSKEQMEWAIEINNLGYHYEVARTFEAFKTMISDYLNP